MITIAICDDSESVVHQLNSSIQRYAEETEQEITIHKFYSGVELLDKYSENYDILFLDIKMPGIDGLLTAEKIRERDKEVSIIFLTSLVQHAIRGYEVNAASYIIKPISYKRLRLEIDRWCHKQTREKEPFIIVKNAEGSYKVLLKELVYIETANRKALFHTKTRKIMSYKRLKDLEEELKGFGFSRCHSSFIVNLSYIESIEKMDTILLTGNVIPLSQSKRKAFMQSLARFWGEML